MLLGKAIEQLCVTKVMAAHTVNFTAGAYLAASVTNPMHPNLMASNSCAEAGCPFNDLQS